MAKPQSSRICTIGTRGSELALAQTEIVSQALRDKHPELIIERKIIRTTGDLHLDKSLKETGALDKGLFTKELEDALLRSEIDIAVHSLKDLPGAMDHAFCLAAILPRAPDADMLISKSAGGLDNLPSKAVVATSSPRRTMQLKARRPDVVVVNIRGNVPTRIRKLAEDPSLHAIVLAEAGLQRLSLLEFSQEDMRVRPFENLHVSRLVDFLPAPGQGAIAVQMLASNPYRPLLQEIHHPPTARCVEVERMLLQKLGGGCHLALGARASIANNRLFLEAIYFQENTDNVFHKAVDVPIEQYQEAASLWVKAIS